MDRGRIVAGQFNRNRKLKDEEGQSNGRIVS